MDGTAELERLAELLRISAGVGRQIAEIRPGDADELRHVALQAERLAAALEAMTKRAVSAHDLANPPAGGKLQ